MSEMNPEELYPPKAGGAVDTARKKAASDAEQAAAVSEAVPVREPKMDVAVNDYGTELARARTFSVATGGTKATAELLGRDDNRKVAVIMTLDEPVVISFSVQAADDPRNQANAAGLSANGFVLPVNVPVPVPSKGIIYATATSATPTRVSVMAFSYERPEMAG